LWVGDLDGDVHADMIVGTVGELPRVLRNELTGGAGLGLRLHGTTSNHLGLGAIVTLEADGVPVQTRWMGEVAAEGTLPSTEIFVGLGAASEATVTVAWPSGVVQRVTNLSVGVMHTITEPSLVSLSEGDRHLPADGEARLVVEVTPRGPDGAHVAAGTVDVSLRSGAALATPTWAGPAVENGGVWRRELVAPLSAGSSVIEVRIDGVLVPISPRVWWDAVGR
jgi:hypothetical protein